MAEETDTGGPIFIDVASGTEQYPVTEVFSHTTTTEEQQSKNKIKNEKSASPDNQLQDNPLLKIQTRKIRCPECSRFSAENEEKMARHIRKVHRGENPFQCYMCDYSTYNKPLFEEHVRIHQGIKPFKCSHCPYRSVSKKNTKKHELIHRPDNPLRCKDCDFIARNPKALKAHNQQHFLNKNNKEEKSFQCQKCDQVFFCKIYFNNHKKSRKKCKICNEVVCNKLYKKHMKESHSVEYPYKRRKGLNKEELFVCRICKWSSSTKPRILLHLIHHPKQNVDETEIDISVLKRFGIMVGL